MNTDKKIKLSWKEKLAAWVVLVIGIGYLLLQVVNLISSKSAGYSATEGALVINKAELFSDIKTYFYILTGITGGILLLKAKKAGWILSVPYLLIFTVLASWGMLFSIKMHTYGSLAFLATVWILLLLSLFFLLRPAGLEKYRVSKTTVLPTLAFLVLIIVLYIFLQ